MTTRQKKAIAAMKAARKIHHNIDGSLVCGETRRAGIRNNEDVKVVTCEACLSGKKARKQAAKKQKAAKLDVKSNVETTPIEAAVGPGKKPKAAKAVKVADATTAQMVSFIIGGLRVSITAAGAV